MEEKKPKRGVILILSDSMLKPRYGMNVQELVNERGKNVLVNAVGGVTAERAMTQGVERTWELSDFMRMNGVTGSDVKGVIVMVGTNDFDNGLKRGEAVAVTAERIKRCLLGIERDLERILGRKVGVRWVKIMGRTDVGQNDIKRRQINDYVGAALRMEGWMTRGYEQDYGGYVGELLDRWGLHPNSTGLDVLGWTVLRLIEGRD